jgi:hypothetical protein
MLRSAVSDARRDAHEAVLAVAEHEAHRLAFGRRAGAAVVQHQQQLVARRHVPDVGLAMVHVERLHRAGSISE